MRRLLMPCLMLLLVGTCAPAFSQEGLLPGSRPLSRTLQALEGRKIHPSSVVVEDRHWRIEGIQGKESFRYLVDPRTGRIVSQEKIPDLSPIQGSMPVSRIVRNLEEASPGPIVRVRYDEKNWVVETRKGKTTTEIRLSAATGVLTGGKDEK